VYDSKILMRLDNP